MFKQRGYRYVRKGHRLRFRKKNQAPFFGQSYKGSMDTGTSYHERLRRVLRHIDTHADETPSLDELASIACFSPHHFHRVFTAMVGESVAAYVRRLTLQRAAQRVSYSRESITRIAFDAGYDSLEAFSRAFRSLFGVSPSRYRKEGGSPVFTVKADTGPYLFYHANPEVEPVDIQVKRVDPRLVATLRHVGPYEACGPVWARLCELIGASGLIDPKGVAYGICHDDPDTTPAEKCRMEVCFTLPEGVTEDTPALAALLTTTDLYVREVGNGGEYACVLVKGPYSLLHPAYRSLFGEWLPGSGRELGDSIGFEAYYNDPTTTPPDELLTEIFVPLKPRG